MADVLAKAVREGVCVKTDQVRWSARTGRFGMGSPNAAAAFAIGIELGHSQTLHVISVADTRDPYLRLEPVVRCF